MKCPKCGAMFVKKGNLYKCKYCGYEELIDEETNNSSEYKKYPNKLIDDEIINEIDDEYDESFDEDESEYKIKKGEKDKMRLLPHVTRRHHHSSSDDNRAKSSNSEIDDNLAMLLLFGFFMILFIVGLIISYFEGVGY